MEARLEPIFREAIECRGRTREDLENGYKKITTAILLRSGLGSPTNIEVVRETTAALQSIFPQTELRVFWNADSNEKRKQLLEFTGIVAGIRLYNKDCSRGGAGIDDVPYLLSEGIPITLQTLMEELRRATDSAAFHTWLFLKIAAVDPIPDRPGFANVTAKTADLDGVTIYQLRAAVINARQYEMFLRVIIRELSMMKHSVEKLIVLFQNNLKKLHGMIGDKPAVPSSEVYPIFIRLANIWANLQDEMVFLSVLTNNLSNLQLYFVGRRLALRRERLGHLISDAEIVYDHQRVSEGPLPIDDRFGYTCIFPNSESGLDTLTVEFSGFCAWSLVRYQGLLIPADADIGVMLIPPDNRMYAFSSHEAARDFLMASDHFVKAVSQVARSLPELIPLLRLDYAFAKGLPDPKDNSFIEKPLHRVEAGIQTEVHPIKSYIDKTYEWNEWELRKKALKLANLRKKATTSVQTVLSNWRRDNATQVYLPKDSWTTTKEDGYTQVPKPSIFIHGLRGCGVIDQAPQVDKAILGNKNFNTLYRETNATVVDLTIPVEQQLLGSVFKGTIKWEPECTIVEHEGGDTRDVGI